MDEIRLDVEGVGCIDLNRGESVLRAFFYSFTWGENKLYGAIEWNCMWCYFFKYTRFLHFGYRNFDFFKVILKQLENMKRFKKSQDFGI